MGLIIFAQTVKKVFLLNLNGDEVEAFSIQREFPRPVSKPVKILFITVSGLNYVKFFVEVIREISEILIYPNNLLV
jgi:hypothetical protein